MASNRHLGRVIVLQSLYEYELRSLAGDPEVDLDIIIAKNIEPYEKTLGDTEFVYNLARKVRDNFSVLDGTLQPLAPEWPIGSVSAIDRNILRMGLFELSECRDSIPPKVAINEAVELAKAFGSENSSRFINGVLGTAYRGLGIEEENDGTGNESAGKGGEEHGDTAESTTSRSRTAKGGERAATTPDGAATETTTQESTASTGSEGASDEPASPDGAAAE